MISNRKRLGQYFTPDEVASSLVRWVVRRKTDRILDPSCGDGQFLKHHRHSVGVEICAEAASEARKQAPSALVHGGEFFRWASATSERFDGIAGNPPFIRFQSFKGEVRAEALAAASVMGANFSALTSSWAPFVLVAAGLLKFGGRMAFVVPAEIGHANYARELIPALCGRFREVRVIACREKLFPALSEDCWLLWCDGYGSRCGEVGMSILDRFMPSMEVPAPNRGISLSEWNAMGGRLRPFLLTVEEREIYRDLKNRPTVRAFGDLANASIGYVSGANDFFHLRPSQANSF
ncbi:MAG: N-6 DNA methylase, partial [Verrucomicrobiae bacterium]|nr:N-6 DNA methylase [Verrucomicrobiae bacterium]